MNVLLVEDHTDTRQVLNALLSRCGCHIVPAKNMKEAHTRLAEMSFAILICDLNLPDGDGLELVRAAKQTQQLKAIALTGRESDEDRAKGMEAGFDCYLTKPIDFQQLRTAIGK